MTRQQLIYVIKVYKEIIQTQLLHPEKLRTAANYILDRDVNYPISTVQARRIINSFYNNKSQEMLNDMDELFSQEDNREDKTDSITPEPQPSKEDQSHGETSDPNEINYKGIKEDDVDDNDDKNVSEDIEKDKAKEKAKKEINAEIEKLTSKRDMSEDINERRSFSMKINHLKKKLEKEK